MFGTKSAKVAKLYTYRHNRSMGNCSEDDLIIEI